MEEKPIDGDIAGKIVNRPQAEAALIEPDRFFQGTNDYSLWRIYLR